MLGVSQIHGDVVAGAAAAEVTLVGPGVFTLPLVFDSQVPAWLRAQLTSHSYFGDRPLGPGPQCGLDVAAGPQPVDVDHLDYQSSFVSSEARFVPPVGLHSPGTLQAELEEMVDPKEHWLGALAWHVGLEGLVPFDVLYVRPGEKIVWMQITQEPTCVGIAISQEDEVITGQAAGCPPGSDPLARFDASDLVEMDNLSLRVRRCLP